MAATSSLHPSYLHVSGQERKSFSAEQRVVNDIFSIFMATSTSTSEIAKAYFSTIHTWLPIVSRQRFDKRLLKLDTTPNAAFALLVLSMHFIIQIPDSKPRESILDESLYRTTQQTFLLLHALLPPSLDLVQAAILISLYQYGHGINSAAYLTSGIATRLCQALGLYRDKHITSKNTRSSLSKRAEESRTLWGAILGEM